MENNNSLHVVLVSIVSIVAIIGIIFISLESKKDANYNGLTDKTGYVVGSALASDDCSRKCTYIIDPTVKSIKSTSFGGIKAGDTLCFTPGTRNKITIASLKGTESDPITITNCGGQTIIDASAGSKYGVQISNSTYFRLTGSGHSGSEYGINILNSNGSSLFIYGLSSNYEVDHIEVSGGSGAGLLLKSDPRCDGTSNRGRFIQKNTLIHDNYIHDTVSEGMYVGSSSYAVGNNVNCSGVITKIYSHDLQGVRIYNNKISSTGLDGIQLASATKDVQVYGNVITNPAIRRAAGRDTGIVLNAGTSGDVYGNTITGGYYGIRLNAAGDNNVFNNIIISSAQDGIITSKTPYMNDNKGYHINNNLIINPARYGLYFATLNGTTSTFRNNIVIGGKKTYQTLSPKLSASNNLNNSDINYYRFANAAGGDYHIMESSPAVNAGVDSSDHGVAEDFDGVSRPQGSLYDIGPFEYAVPDADLDGYKSSDDCDDNDVNIHPGVIDICGNDIDEDCSGMDLACPSVDEDFDGVKDEDDCDDYNSAKWQFLSGYVDADGDLYTVGSSTQLCSGNFLPAGYAGTSSGTDCDDSDSFKWRMLSGYIDADGDKYTSSTVSLCTGNNVPVGFVSASSGKDCKDNDANINPGKTEVCGNGIDENCDGLDTVCPAAPPVSPPPSVPPTNIPATCSDGIKNGNEVGVDCDGSCAACVIGGGNLTAFISKGYPLGHWVYLPANYNPNRATPYPVLYMLRGNGERGNGSVQSSLDLLKKNGILKLIVGKNWPPNKNKLTRAEQVAISDMIVIVPQDWTDGSFSHQRLQALVWNIEKRYNVDESRTYATGLSAGGIGISNYLKEHPGNGSFAAVVPIAPNMNSAQTNACAHREVAIWVFHGASDTNTGTPVLSGPNFREATLSCNPAYDVKVRTTMYANCGHAACVWDETYNLSKLNAPTLANYTNTYKKTFILDPYDQNIYSWMLQYSK